MTKQEAEQERELCATVPEVVPVDNGQTSKLQGQSDQAVGEGKRVPVIFWMPDGSCGEGTTHYVGGEIMFIESKRVVPVGTEVTIRPTPPNDASTDWGVAEGAVVWTCPSVDQFKNREGFGVSLHGCWPLPEVTATEGSKGSA